MDASGYSDPGSMGYAMPQSGAGGFDTSAHHNQSEDAVPDAMHHLLTAAEAASTGTKRK